jgi:hypothetical protein
MLNTFHNSKFKEKIFSQFKNRYLLQHIFEYCNTTDKLVTFRLNKLTLHVLKESKEIIDKLIKKFKGYLKAYSIGRRVRLDEFLKTLKKKNSIINLNFNFFAKEYISQWINKHFYNDKRKIIFNIKKIKSLTDDTRTVFIYCVINCPNIIRVELRESELNKNDKDIIKEYLRPFGKVD